jgi:hypothetical protein
MDETRSKPSAQPGFEQAYREAWQMAVEKLSGKDPAEVARDSGALLENNGGQSWLCFSYLGQDIRLSPASGETKTASGETIPPRDRLVILHYLVTAGGTPPAGRLITFQQLPDGQSYYPTFFKRAVKPLLSAFAAHPALLKQSAQPLGGVAGGMGDVSVTFKALPRVELTLVIWQGDDELPAEGSILFDSSIGAYLPTEDITVLSEIIAWRLVKLAAPFIPR